jgi:hypothetical protein
MTNFKHILRRKVITKLKMNFLTLPLEIQKNLFINFVDTSFSITHVKEMCIATEEKCWLAIEGTSIGPDLDFDALNKYNIFHL